jgi:catechol 2,3-dioxygenase-like lactoylglutathione lyase family enzyme
LTLTPYFHIGILVVDLEAAVDRFSSAMGLSFRPVRTTSIDHIEDPEDHPGAHRGTYSYEGPPYIELLEATTDSRLWSPDQGEGIHHIGLWAPEDLDSFQDTLEARGFPGDVRLRGPEGDLMAWFNKPASLHGTRLEVISPTYQPGVEAWLMGETDLPR